MTARKNPDVTPEASAWFARRTSSSEQWPTATVSELKQRSGLRVSVVVPARDEESTIGEVVSTIRSSLMVDSPLVDELVVMDSDSTDGTGEVARKAGASVYRSRDVAAETGNRGGKGEALWKSLFVTTGDVLVFVDADLTLWGPHFVTGLVGPLLSDEGVLLVKGFYDRVADTDDAPEVGPVGGRVTELVARPLLSLFFPQLTTVVQPLAGEWAARRSLMESLPIPVGYGVEMSTLLDTVRRHGLDAVAQVDLGRRAHRHQADHDLALMAAEVMAVVRSRATGASAGAAELCQYVRDEGGGSWVSRPVPTDERQPAREVPSDRSEPDPGL